jgi:very-short-patch-repair endonuclease
MTDRPVWPNEDRFKVMRACLQAFCRILMSEFEEDVRRGESVDFTEQTYLVVYWSRYIDDTFELPKIAKTTDETERLRLIFEVFGAGLGMPSGALKTDITQRLEWTKRRVAKDFEREFRKAIDWNTVTSPIEQIFLMEWKYQRIEDRLGVTLEPQRKLPTSRGEYAVDFCVMRRATRTPLVVIEIDGHDFHEKSKEQARSDKQRERAIIRAGTTVLRFSASEVFREPRGCVEEVIAFIEEQSSRPS